MSLHIGSSSFGQDQEIPSRHTCDGNNISPELAWTGIPKGAKSLVLIVDDPDAPDPAAPKMTWVHWLLYNIPFNTTNLAEGIAERNLPGGTLQGLNDWSKTGYGGPCPPVGKHHYFFKLYALDAELPDLRKPNKSALEKAMQGHMLDQASLVGLYRRHLNLTKRKSD